MIKLKYLTLDKVEISDTINDKVEISDTVNDKVEISDTRQS